MRSLLLMSIAAVLLFAPYAGAQTAANAGAIDVIPAASADEGGPRAENVLETHPALKLTPDKSAIVALDADAGTVILGNPAHLNILVDSARRLIAVPKAPGASYFTVLDKDGAVIMQRHVLVAAPKEKYVRVRKTCYGDSAKAGCVPTQTYYCPDICHEVATGYEQRQASGNADAPASSQGTENTEGADKDTAEPIEDPVQE